MQYHVPSINTIQAFRHPRTLNYLQLQIKAMAFSAHLTIQSLFLLSLLTSAAGEDRTEIPGAINIYDIQNLGRTAVILYDHWTNRDTSWLSFCRVLYAAQQTDDRSVYFLTILASRLNGGYHPMGGYDAVVHVSSNSRELPKLVSFVSYPDQGGFMGDGQVPLNHPVDCFKLV